MMDTGGLGIGGFARKLEALAKLRHPRIVSLIAVVTEKPIWVVCQLIVGTDLLKFLRAQPTAREPAPLKTLMNIARQICEGMQYLESQSISHCNLAARAVMIDAAGSCYVGDFGMVDMLSGEGISTSLSIRWTAPEVTATRLFSPKADCWSFGVVMSEILTYGKEPYSLVSDQALVHQLAGGARMPRPSGCPSAVSEPPRAPCSV